MAVSKPAKKKIDTSKLKLGPKKEVVKSKSTAAADEKKIDKIHAAAPSSNGTEEETVRFTLDVPTSLHTDMKLKTITDKTSLKKYILNLVRKDMGKPLED